MKKKKTREPIRLNSKNYKSYLPLDIVAFSWAFGALWEMPEGLS